MAKKVTNKERQAIPFQHREEDGSLKFRNLLAKETIVMDDSRITQYLLDLHTSGHITITDTADPITAGFEGSPGDG